MYTQFYTVVNLAQSSMASTLALHSTYTTAD